MWTGKTNDCIIKNHDSKAKKIPGKDDWTIFKTHENKFINDLITLIRKKSNDMTKLKIIALITIEMH